MKLEMFKSGGSMVFLSRIVRPITGWLTTAQRKCGSGDLPISRLSQLLYIHRSDRAVVVR